MGNWTITVPESTTNLILNPSAGAAGNYAAYAGAAITRDTTRARYGAYCYKAVCAFGDGLTLTVPALANAIHTLTFYIDAATNLANINVIVAANNLGAPTAITSGANWRRVTVQIPAAVANGATTISLVAVAAITFYVDAVQVEAKAYYTTYADGDQAGCVWAGVRHGSTSARAANHRLGGREYDIEAQYGLRVRSFVGAGSPDSEILTQDLALQPGAIYLRDKINARTLTLVMDNHQTSLALLHSRRKAFWAVIKPDATGQRQPFLIGYNGGASGRTVYAAVRYAGGWGIEGGIEGGANFIEGGGRVGLRLLAVDPYWYADDSETATLGYQTSLASNNYAIARINGAWQNLGTGFDNQVLAIAIDYERGRVYFGGDFTTANGVTVNHICYWDGTTFVALGNGVAAGSVWSIAIAPNGDVWVGGDFTTVDGTAGRNYVARWNVSSGTWSHFGTTGTGAVNALAVDQNGIVYVGGVYLNWAAIGAADNIVSYDGTAWAALGSGVNGGVNALAVDQSNVLYAVGGFTAAGGAAANFAARWNGSAWAALGSGLGSNVLGCAIGKDNSLYVVGNFTTAGGVAANYIARWNGNAWSALGSGLNGGANAIAVSDTGQVFVGGAFSTAGGLALDSWAVWNGTAWIRYDADLPGTTSTIYEIKVDPAGNIYIGTGDTGTAYVSSRTTVTVRSTAPVYPVITIKGTTSAGRVQMLLQWIENQTTGERLYFNLAINGSETHTLDLRPASRKLVSSWRGQIFDQPLPTSDFSAWHLAAGDNVIAAFVIGTTAGATITLNWATIHDSLDGDAA